MAQKYTFPLEGERTKATIIADTTGIEEMHRARERGLPYLLSGRDGFQEWHVRMPKKNNICAQFGRVCSEGAESRLNAPFVTVAKKNGVSFDVQKTLGFVG